ncbi:hypothetical protein ACFC08_28490 [Streptomyces sp. NPDC056112]|uniref:hypothetical protein n=1 Tax=Streptomyces sp. NPDC056112 TaxID=3345715 RepID=UPI0035D81A0A
MAHTTPHTPAWHALEEADERAWLDSWARRHPIPAPEHPEPSTAAPVPALTPAGRP